jgi:hypothetical protein
MKELETMIFFWKKKFIRATQIKKRGYKWYKWFSFGKNGPLWPHYQEK